MKAAVVHSFDHPPKFGDITAPLARPGEVVVSMRVAALSQLVRAQASGKHYSSGRTLPFVPGADAVGRSAGGKRVYFAFPLAPIGTMAEQVAVKSSYVVELPDDVDDVTAAAIANPGMSSWAALEDRAHLRRGEAVLINGAAGTSGRLAIRIAKHFGASRVAVTARNPVVEGELRALGADRFIALNQPAESLVLAFRDEIASGGANVVLDYLWGSSAESFIQAATGHGSGEAGPRIRFVNIGALAGHDIHLPGGALRSSRLELLGSGLGSVSNERLVQIVGELLRAVTPAGLTIDAMAVPLTEVESVWNRPSRSRVVFTID